jgi:hypothetical protein
MVKSISFARFAFWSCVRYSHSRFLAFLKDGGQMGRHRVRPRKGHVSYARCEEENNAYLVALQHEIHSAMLMGIFVIAFPVSVFSDLWSKELRRSGALASLLEDNEDNDDSNDECDTDIREKEKGGGSCNRSNIGNEQDPISQLDASASAAQFHSSGPSSMAAAAPFSMPHQPSLDWPDVGPYNTRGDHHGGGDTIVLEKNDLADILVQLHCIQDSQRQIRHILRKYKIQLDPPGLQRQDAPPRGIL